MKGESSRLCQREVSGSRRPGTVHVSAFGGAGVWLHQQRVYFGEGPRPASAWPLTSSVALPHTLPHPPPPPWHGQARHIGQAPLGIRQQHPGRGTQTLAPRDGSAVTTQRPLCRRTAGGRHQLSEKARNVPERGKGSPSKEQSRMLETAVARELVRGRPDAAGERKGACVLPASGGSAGPRAAPGASSAVTNPKVKASAVICKDS